MPTSALEVEIVVLIFVSVKSPVTIEGVTKRVTPLPLESLMGADSIEHTEPFATGVHSGVSAPVLELSTHAVLITPALKLPLLCAKTGKAPIAIPNIANMRPAATLLCDFTGSPPQMKQP